MNNVDFEGHGFKVKFVTRSNFFGCFFCGRQRHAR